jgi:hypothetical protein
LCSDIEAWDQQNHHEQRMTDLLNSRPDIQWRWVLLN